MKFKIRSEKIWYDLIWVEVECMLFLLWVIESLMVKKKKDLTCFFFFVRKVIKGINFRSNLIFLVVMRGY